MVTEADLYTLEQKVHKLEEKIEYMAKEAKTGHWIEEIVEGGRKGAIELLEQTKWISISERLPEENGWYQCTVILNALPLTMDLFYKNGKWLDNRRINMFDTYDIYGYGNTTEKHKLSYQELISEFDWTKNVVAWKPLPKPYKAESEEKQ